MCCLLYCNIPQKRILYNSLYNAYKIQQVTIKLQKISGLIIIKKIYNICILNKFKNRNNLFLFLYQLHNNWQDALCIHIALYLQLWRKNNAFFHRLLLCMCDYMALIKQPIKHLFFHEKIYNYGFTKKC